GEACEYTSVVFAEPALQFCKVVIIDYSGVEDVFRGSPRLADHGRRGLYFLRRLVGLMEDGRVQPACRRAVPCLLELSQETRIDGLSKVVRLVDPVRIGCPEQELGSIRIAGGC